MFECPLCGEENFQEDARQGYCSSCRAFTRSCSIGLCDEHPAVTAGNVALCRPHADEIGWSGNAEREPESGLPS